MRIAGGVILLIVGLWSLAGGGCSLVGGKMVGGMADGASKLSGELQKAAAKAGGSVNNKAAEEAAKALSQASSAGTGLMVSGIVILLAGILCVVAGIMLFTNKGKMFGIAAGGLGILGEVIFFAMVAFNIGGLIKILLYGFAAFASTKVGEAS